jgi:hypothetical protein
MIATSEDAVREHVQTSQDGDQWLHGDIRDEHWFRDEHCCYSRSVQPSRRAYPQFNPASVAQANAVQSGLGEQVPAYGFP